SKPMLHQATSGATAASCSGSGAQIDNRSNYTSLLTSDNVTISNLGTAINAATTCFVSADESSVTIAWDPANAVPPATYRLTVTGVNDKASNVINPNPTDTNVTFTDTTPPTITSLTWGGASSFTVIYSEAVLGGLTDPNSAGNPANYAVNALAYGNLCSGTTTMTASNSGKTWTLSCSGSGTWGAQNTNTLHVHNVQDRSGNVINPNTAKPF
ncbi:MAG TPA: hypothetical protein VGS17_01220, partial [Candidatus Limnocylindria bacterium]|nr:hypothetical protein [Candidatus Limnocylindria bacterium]